MLVIPAIDLYEGQVVRLERGRLEARTVYYDDPLVPARAFAEAGASWLHVVDLEGAFTGAPRHLDLLRRLKDALPALKLELGGGLRTTGDLEAAFRAGADRVILGTRALEDFDFLADCAADLGERLVVGLDAADGLVRTHGWTRPGSLSALDAARQCVSIGVRRFIYTDISRDGVFTGPNYQALEALCKAVPVPVIASGGVSGPAHVRALCDLHLPNLEGVIVGKALYDGRTTCAELFQAGDCNAG